MAWQFDRKLEQVGGAREAWDWRKAGKAPPDLLRGRSVEKRVGLWKRRNDSCCLVRLRLISVESQIVSPTKQALSPMRGSEPTTVGRSRYFCSFLVHVAIFLLPFDPKQLIYERGLRLKGRKN